MYFKSCWITKRIYILWSWYISPCYISDPPILPLPTPAASRVCCHAISKACLHDSRRILRAFLGGRWSAFSGYGNYTFTLSSSTGPIMLDIVGDHHIDWWGFSGSQRVFLHDSSRNLIVKELTTQTSIETIAPMIERYFYNPYATMK